MRKVVLMAFGVASLLMSGNGFASVVASGDDCGADCHWSITDDGVMTISGSGPMTSNGGNGAQPWYGKGSVSKLVIEEGITEIQDGNFDWLHMTEVSLPNSLKRMNGGFRGNDFENLVIPNNVEWIGSNTFSANENLQSLVIGENTILGEDAFICRGCEGNNARLNGNLKLYCPAGNTSCTSAVEKILATDNASSSFSATDMVKTYTKTADGYYQIDGELYGSADMMPKGADYSCGATTSICSTVLSEVGGANCDTIKSCRNLAEMADANVYCNSMSGCKELTDLVGSETYCDSLASCKALSDMAASGEYCTTVEECKALNDMVGGENCDSLASCKALSDMAASGEYCTTVAECKRFMDLMNSGYCEGFEACKEMFNASVINYDGKRYGSLEDLYNGNALPSIMRQEQGDGSFAVYKDGVFAGYKGKRIYTTEEANRVTKPMGNTLKIKYR